MRNWELVIENTVIALLIIADSATLYQPGNKGLEALPSEHRKKCIVPVIDNIEIFIVR